MPIANLTFYIFIVNGGLHYFSHRATKKLGPALGPAPPPRPRLRWPGPRPRPCPQARRRRRLPWWRMVAATSVPAANASVSSSPNPRTSFLDPGCCELPTSSSVGDSSSLLTSSQICPCCLYSRILLILYQFLF